MSKPSSNENVSINLPPNFLEEFELKISFEDKYRDIYNEFAKDGKNFEAVSILSNIRNELYRICKKEKEEVLDDVRFIKSQFHRKSNRTKTDKELGNIFEKIDEYFSFDVKPIHLIIRRDDLLKLVESYYEKNNYDGFSAIKHEIDSYYYYKKETNKRILHLEAIEETIDRIIERDYPDSLPEAKEDKIEERERKKPGPKTPQKLLDDIEAILEEALEIEELKTEGGRLVINRALEFAMTNSAFYKSWVDGEKKEYSDRRLKDLFNQVLEKMQSSNSS